MSEQTLLTEVPPLLRLRPLLRPGCGTPGLRTSRHSVAGSWPTSCATAASGSRQRMSGCRPATPAGRTAPGDAGLRPAPRRRTPGLRREEVATLAGVGVTWYTWLEQGRDINPSPEGLDALAPALRLHAAERRTPF